jgi:phosphoribosyl-ATP pyrophosphohydrolase/phosphoribosyl-AMP cyclohydrolase
VPDSSFIQHLESIIEQRLASNSDASYTVQLAREGSKRVAQKIGEEGVELALAAVAGDRDEVLDEAADLVYHLLVLLQLQGASLADVAAVLKQRHSN